jgi:ubiquinone biosynthesis protein COQ9
VDADVRLFEPERAAILEAALTRAPFEGWTSLTLRRAAADAGVSPSTLAAAFPGGVGAVIAHWSNALDRQMTEAMTGPEFAALRIRDKVRRAIEARLDALRPHKEAARRAAATLALPVYGGLGARLVWACADAVWRGLGDASTDFNYYSKRAILAGVWGSTFARWLADESPDETATRAFLARRIENVMQIEKAKARLRETGIDPARPLGWLARLRYPSGR